MNITTLINCYYSMTACAEAGSSSRLLDALHPCLTLASGSADLTNYPRAFCITTMHHFQKKRRREAME